MLGKTIVGAALFALLAQRATATVPETPSQTPSPTGTPSGTPTRTRTGTRSPSGTPSGTASETATPSKTPSNTPSPTPIVCSNDKKLVSVELFSNFGGCSANDNHFGDDLDNVLTVPCQSVPDPILDVGALRVRRLEGNAEALSNPVIAELENEARKENEERQLHYYWPTPSPSPVRNEAWDYGEYYNGTTYGGVVLTDQQPVALTFTSPCWDWPCTFGLRRLAMVLENLPRYNLPWDAPAHVSFKIELGRYYTNLPPPAYPTPWRRNLAAAGAADNNNNRALHDAPSGPSFYEPYVNIQSTVWSAHIIVPENQTLFYLDLSGLYYTLWRESPFVQAGDFKLIITPYIHYDSDTSQPDQILWLLNQPAWNSLPDSDFHFSRPTSFNMRPGCPSHHGIMSNSGRQLLTAEESAGANAESNNAAVAPLDPNGRSLNSDAWSWWPDVCILRNTWACVPFYPSIQLEALLPCEIVFSAVRDEILNQREGEERIQIRTVDPENPELPPPPFDVDRRRLHNTNSWHHPNVYYSIDCPPGFEGHGFDAPFTGADTTAFGRYLSPNEHALRTVDLAGTVEHTDLLFVFQAPCTRCNIYLREIWLPLARDPLCAAEIHFHTHLGFWTGDGITGDSYPFEAFSPSTWANGVHTVMTLGTHLAQDGIFMGSFDHKARIDIPYYGNGSVTWIGIHVTTSSCVRLGTGLDQSSQSLCVESPITPAALFTGADTPDNATSVHPSRHIWLNSGAVPGIFAPVIKVEPWLPICIPLLPTPSPVASPTAGPSNGASPSATPVGGSPSRTPSRIRSPNPGHGASGTLIRVAGLGTDNANTSSGLMASIGAGGIAGIVIAAVAGAILVAAAVVVVASKRSTAARASAASAGPVAASSAGDAPAAPASGEAPARSPAANNNATSRPSATSP